MAAPAWRPAPKRIELSVTEARIRFLQLIRLTAVTRQETVIVDQGRPVAAIVPPDVLADRPNTVSAAGWLQRLETIRDDLRRQHAVHAAELRKALDEAWEIIDDLRPSGSDRHVDTLRTAHAQLRRQE